MTEQLTRPPCRGSVALVGTGPGDPDLLTVRAARLIAIADVVIHDRLVHPDVLALTATTTRRIDVGKMGNGPSTSQRAIDDLMIAQARLGHRVVRAKGGDPFVFGRGGEEALALAAAGVPFEIVPGVSAGLAAPAAALIPLTHRGVARAVTFATATLAGGEPDWAYLAGAGTLVVFMAGARLAHVAAQLIAAGRAAHTPAAVIVAATWAEQDIVDGTLAHLATHATADRTSPALLVVGEVVAIGSELRALRTLANQPRHVPLTEMGT